MKVFKLYSQFMFVYKLLIGKNHLLYLLYILICPQTFSYPPFPSVIHSVRVYNIPGIVYYTAFRFVQINNGTTIATLDKSIFINDLSFINIKKQYLCACDLKKEQFNIYIYIYTFHLLFYYCQQQLWGKNKQKSCHNSR